MAGALERSPARRRKWAPPKVPIRPPEIATEQDPAPDGSYDVPLPEVAPGGEPEPGPMPRPGSGARQPSPRWPRMPEPGEPELPGDPDENAATEPANGPPSNAHGAAAPVAPPTDDERAQARMRRLFAAWNETGIPDRDKRDVRLALWSAMLGREVTSSTRLDRHDVYSLTGLCADLASGALEWWRDDETGRYHVARRDDGPAS
jgi:hypothetical protein